jgi:DNA-binding response OmpR family regulator
MTSVAAEATGQRPCVLIVDDDADNRELLEILLGPQGFLTLTAESGDDALAVVAERKPDVVLLDLMMPGMDGYEVVRRMKANPATKHIPIIMVTAIHDGATRMLALRAGASDFVTKPVNLTDLCARVKHQLTVQPRADG